MESDLKKISSFLEDLEAFQKSESYKLFLFLRENRTLMTILNDNYRELNKILEYHNSDPIMIKLLDSDPTFRFRLQKQIIRILSNYLSSLFAVVDYSRSTICNYFKGDEEVLKKYHLEKDTFLNGNRYHKFIQDLRNYTNHNTFIKIGSEISFNHEWTGLRKSIYVQKSELLEWTRWNAESKSFIKSQEEKIRLNEILKNHFIKFSSFQDWTYLQILLVNSAKTEKFITEFEDFYNRALSVKKNHLLIFNKAYIRYIKWIYQKANLN